MPDNQGRDILLAGILSDEEHLWHAQLSTILCAMIFIEKEASAFLIMRKWAEIILSGQIPERDEARFRLVKFIVGVGARVQQRSQKNARPGLRPLPITGLFKHELIRWQTEGRRTRHPIGPLAQEIVGKLTF